MSAGDVIAKQRAAFLRDAPPGLEARRGDLKALRAAIIARRRDIEDAIDADFDGRSPRETALVEVFGAVQAIDYLSRNQTLHEA